MVVAGSARVEPHPLRHQSPEFKALKHYKLNLNQVVWNGFASINSLC